MNYRHAFHAGGFADVFKHVVLCRILHHLHGKPTAFRVIDTHAGAGLYDLSSAEARRGGEWHNGIEKLVGASLTPKCAALLEPYLACIATLNKSGDLRVYPGSPALIRAWLRPQDRLLAYELEPQTAATLARHFRGDRRIKVSPVDGWQALTAHLPPPERRGAVLIDPAFEEEKDFRRLAETLAAAHRKWATGVYLLWYPIKDRVEPDALAERLRRSGIANILRAELVVSPSRGRGRLIGSGLVVVNPPWRLEEELTLLLPVLAKILGHDRPLFSLDRLADERAAGR